MPEKSIMNIAYGKPNPLVNGKKDWITVGHLIISYDDMGNEVMRIKLNEIPLDADFEGDFSVFPQDRNGSHSNKKIQQIINKVA